MIQKVAKNYFPPFLPTLKQIYKNVLNGNEQRHLYKTFDKPIKDVFCKMPEIYY